jgi:AAA domain (dynein-related subfamily)
VSCPRCRRVGSCRAFQKGPQEEIYERASGKGYMTLHPYTRQDATSFPSATLPAMLRLQPSADQDCFSCAWSCPWNWHSRTIPLRCETINALGCQWVSNLAYICRYPGVQVGTVSQEVAKEPMGSYVVKTDDIREVIRQMDALKGTATLDYKEDLLNHLKEDEFRRIKWFFYCDDVGGNTIRVFDRQFCEKFRSLFGKKYMLLEGKNLGEEGQQPKSEMLLLFSDRKDGYPPYVTWKGDAKALDYFEQLNSNPNDGEDDVLSINSTKSLDDNLLRYQPLVNETFLDHTFFKRFESLLDDQRQVILEGPPGSGKTFVARNFAKWWTEPQASGAGAGSKWRVVQFHESYGYEDFFQGIRPQLLNTEGKVIESSDTETAVGQMVYRNCAGIFRKFCDDAGKPENKDARFVLVIDEINRGKASRIFGELLYVLEYRDEEIELASGEMFHVPKNVYMIGTMNTADRSIALVDYALRRRFKFVGLRPYQNGDAPVLRSWLRAKSISNVDHIVKRFCRLNELVKKINPHFIVGHSYFMPRRLQARTQDAAPEAFSMDLLEGIWEFSILPLMSEYEPHRSLDELTEDYAQALLGPV